MNRQETKNQHYVPQFYFDQFFTAPFCYLTVPRKDDERILFSKKAYKRTQSSEKYFYGANQELENKYGQIENDAAKLVNEIINNKEVLSKDEFELLAKFILSQAVRTKGFLNAFVNMLKSFAAETNTELKYSKQNILYNFYNITGMLAPWISDLSIKIIGNDTNSKLIFSDNPIQIYNSFTPYSHGLIMAGITIIFPLNTKKLLLIYDDKMLNIENSSMTESDIREYNKLLAVNSEEKIYFQNANCKAEYECIINEIKKYRDSSNLYVMGSTDEKMISFNFPQCNTRPKFSFLKLKKPFGELKFEEKTEFPRLKLNTWAQRFKMSGIFKQIAKLTGNNDIAKYDWSKMNDIVNDYWEGQKLELDSLVNIIKKIGNIRPDIEQMMTILIFGAQSLGISKDVKGM